jgi:hypothetical protein
VQPEKPKRKPIQERLAICLSHFDAIRETNPSRRKVLAVVHATFAAGMAVITRGTPYFGGAVFAVVTIYLAALIFYDKSPPDKRDKEKPPESGP